MGSRVAFATPISLITLVAASILLLILRFTRAILCRLSGTGGVSVISRITSVGVSVHVCHIFLKFYASLISSTFVYRFRVTSWREK